jgi:two-component system chemotaxis response regulator CheY
MSTSPVIVIEDDRTMATMYSRCLAKDGYTVEVESDGVAGLEKVIRTRPRAVVLDYMLPGMNGLDVLKAIRARPDCAQVPVIVMSNCVVTDTVNKFREAGATAVFLKANTPPARIVDAIKSSTSGAATSSSSNASPTSHPNATAGCAVSRLAGAMETLARDIARQPTGATASAIETLAAGVDKLRELTRTTPAPGAVSLARHQVLVVTPEEPVQPVIAQLLTGQGLQSIFASDVAAALQKTMLAPVSLVVVAMPEDGTDPVAAFRAWPKTSATPIVSLIHPIQPSETLVRVLIQLL